MDSISTAIFFVSSCLDRESGIGNRESGIGNTCVSVILDHNIISGVA
ncbi:hypothetical protein [Moorena sp. SIO4G3]|nr:hypothetical protein [Moorena sp. SIO4G3]NEO77205.1 hypothetical protein [Moorena sp. SIO4G3]